ncbi:MAG: hypothetical protein ACD_50C00345G0001 [uncultured bacterium]|nr:MAG: hypothetical protein ACD_50C00345G0001 [uncultured bacterium]
MNFHTASFVELGKFKSSANEIPTKYYGTNSYELPYGLI